MENIYKVVFIYVTDLEEELNKLQEEGRELISCNAKDSWVYKTICILKKRKVPAQLIIEDLIPTIAMFIIGILFIFFG